jgi:GH24 family phage-related lysozyme (muramidase)
MSQPLTANALNTATSVIASEEGFDGVAYWDSTGWAIGYGNHYYQDGSPVQEGDTIDQPTAQALLQFYVEQFYNMQVAPKITVPLTDNQVAGLTSLAYNCGSVPNSLANLINSGASADQINQQWTSVCVTTGGIYSNALYNRREAEANLFDTISQAIQNNPGTSVAVGIAGLGVVIVGGYYLVRAIRAAQKAAA